MRPDNARRNHVLFIVLGCIRQGKDMPCGAEIAAVVGFADGSAVTKALRSLVADGSLRYHHDDNGKVDGYETDLGWTRLNFGTGVPRRRSAKPAPNKIRDQQARDRSTPAGDLRAAILDAVLAEGRNFVGIDLEPWRAAHAQSYEAVA